MLRLLRTNARGRFDRARHVIHPRRDMMSGASLPRAHAYGFGMGHVLRINSLHVLWMSFIAYNCARAGLVFLRGNVEGAQLCLAQTKGLMEGFLAVGSNPAKPPLETRAIVHHQLLTAPHHQPIQFAYGRDPRLLKGLTRARVSGMANSHSSDKPGESCARSALGLMATVTHSEDMLWRSAGLLHREASIWEEAFSWLALLPTLFIAVCGRIQTETGPVAFRFTAMEEDSLARKTVRLGCSLLMVLLISTRWRVFLRYAIE